ncbi:hypothetical protein PHYBLDRAFT_153519 [Phycomyces blakesleeanus NRRL 1555(-)]|uniref:Uncharacterized protein n=1 Tax=Phycomyces blakesleeanus (strain ATCC 8743b / DSM 1359 / FGSC 10004 / NBRC 33097 / NRRL 1555) TaxID=763407 RepID=A0A162W8U0_PHYB8|nr:hypothetical protein PHYBLDRAFT_153519 [Phycomyces blakesleeanus NRRL 1555(-)]OAD65435.1 hypothetical protein PHYBLDRAFT_153519 [Phycomyces blakesleeanus NRRL 1555(-)]|eukprot:XP_018283475.1 hypothetical protein PHYBLDRAFT_153519 [Phycomyces blakesleeanus NRRL 1555(-)]
MYCSGGNHYLRKPNQHGKGAALFKGDDRFTPVKYKTQHKIYLETFKSAGIHMLNGTHTNRKSPLSMIAQENLLFDTCSGSTPGFFTTNVFSDDRILETEICKWGCPRGHNWPGFYFGFTLMSSSDISIGYYLWTCTIFSSEEYNILKDMFMSEMVDIVRAGFGMVSVSINLMQFMIWTHLSSHVVSINRPNNNFTDFFAL